MRLQILYFNVSKKYDQFSPTCWKKSKPFMFAFFFKEDDTKGSLIN